MRRLPGLVTALVRRLPGLVAALVRRLPGLVPALAGAGLAMAAVACGLQVQSPDLFQITRTGQGPRLTLVVSDDGTIRCNGAKAKTISSSLLIEARDLADNLRNDASHQLTLPEVRGTVFYYRIRMQQGTVSFADRDAAGHPELVRAEVFTLAAAQGPCGLSG